MALFRKHSAIGMFLPLFGKHSAIGIKYTANKSVKKMNLNFTIIVGSGGFLLPTVNEAMIVHLSAFLCNSRSIFSHLISCHKLQDPRGVMYFQEEKFVGNS